MKHKPTTPSGTELLTAVQLAAKLGVSKRTITNWTRRKLIPVMRTSQRYSRYDLSKVTAEMEKHEQPVKS